MYIGKYTKISRKVQGGAIYYAIFIGFVVCLISVLFLFTAQVHNQYSDYFIGQDKMKDNVQSALNRVLVHPELALFDKKETLDVFNDGKDSVTVLKTRWGCFIIWEITSTWNKEQYTKHFMTGVNFQKGEPLALYLIEKDNYLSVSGSTTIKGNVYLPKLGVRKAYIEGSGTSLEQMVDGEKYRSGRRLPKPDSLFIHYLSIWLNGKLNDSANIVRYEHALKEGFIQNPFSKNTLILYSENEILIDDGLILDGNIIIYSPKRITIQSKAKLNTILLFSPVIKVSDGFEGSIQLFANDSMIIGKGSRIKYPGYVGLLNEAYNNCFFKIEKSATIEGGIFAWQKHKAIQEPYILIDKGTSITGQVFCSGNIELKGVVNGCIYCNGFKLSTPSSLYENHLLDAIINVKAIPQNFAGYDATLKINKQRLIQCLD